MARSKTKAKGAKKTVKAKTKSAKTKKAAKKVKAAKAPKKLKAAVQLTKQLKKAAVISKKQNLSDSITPLDDRIIVEVETMTKTAGGLFIPMTVTDRPTQGRVVAVGRGHLNKKGRVRPMDVQVGDTVMFTQYGGVNMTVKDKEVLILRESDILGILD